MIVAPLLGSQSKLITSHPRSWATLVKLPVPEKRSRALGIFQQFWCSRDMFYVFSMDLATIDYFVCIFLLVWCSMHILDAFLDTFGCSAGFMHFFDRCGALGLPAFSDFWT